MNRTFIGGLKVLVVAFFFGCGSMETTSQEPILRLATDAPERFEPPAGVSLGDDACKSPLLDPRDGTKIGMVRSFGTGVGDYEVPVGKYGVERGELLRINCNTGEVTGIVRK